MIKDTAEMPNVLNVRVRLLTYALAIILAAMLTVPLGVSPASADVRKADIVLGETVDERGLAVAKCPDIAAEYAIIVDEFGTVYYERNAHTQTQIASITKIMTAIVALEHASLDAEVRVSADAASVGESSAGLQQGDIMTMEAALTALLVSSGNDASVAIAETVGPLIDSSAGSMTAFVSAMNAKAAELGCTNTLFANPHGLDFGIHAAEMYSTASDVATMARYAMQNETFRSIVSKSEATITVKRSSGASELLALESTNILLNTYEGACGIKTGFTALAGQSFAGASNRDGRYLFAVVLNSTSGDMRFYDTTELFDWVYEHEISYKLANSEQAIRLEGTEIPLAAIVAHEDWTDRTVNVIMADPAAEVTIFDLNGNVSQLVHLDKIEGDVREGDVVGSITFKQRNVVLAEIDLVAAEDVKAPNLFEGVGVWFKRLFSAFTDEPRIAETVILNETPLINDKTRL